MAVVIPFVLPLDATSITRVVSLYTPLPGFQAYFDNFGNPVLVGPSDLVRNKLFTSFGFPHSPDIAPSSMDAQNGVIVVPPNAYLLSTLTDVFGPDSTKLTYIQQEVTQPILLLDVTVAPIEPGFSRLRVDYMDTSNNPQTQYFDMPFWEDGDVHPINVQNLVDYMESAFNFLQLELHRIAYDADFANQHMLLRGLIVSGILVSTQATDNLLPTLEAHSIPLSELKSKEVPIVPLPNDITENIISASATAIYPGQVITIYLEETPSIMDKLCLLNTTLDTTVDIYAKTLTATIPANLPFSVKLPMFVVNNGIIKSNKFYLDLKVAPKATSIKTSSGTAYGSPGDSFSIYGHDFGGTAGVLTFTPNITCTTTFWSDTQITGVIPDGAQTGPVNIILPQRSAVIDFFRNDPGVVNNLIITPQISAISASDTFKFEALYKGVGITPTWSIINVDRNIGAGNTSYGTIASDGTYTAPSLVSAPIPLTIVANYKSESGPCFAEASLLVLPSASTLTISPSSFVVAPSYNQRFNLFNGSTKVNDADWYVNGIFRGNETVGFITDSGLYSAPNLAPPTKTVYISAVTNIAGTEYTTHAAARVSLENPSESHALNIEPKLISDKPQVTKSMDEKSTFVVTGPTHVMATQQAQFVATLDSTDVTSSTTWSTPSSSGGTIDSNGLFTAPNSPGSTVDVIGTYSSLTDTAPVIVDHLLVINGPDTIVLNQSAQYSLSYDGVDYGGGSATWSVAPSGVGSFVVGDFAVLTNGGDSSLVNHTGIISVTYAGETATKYVTVVSTATNYTCYVGDTIQVGYDYDDTQPGGGSEPCGGSSQSSVSFTATTVGIVQVGNTRTTLNPYTNRFGQLMCRITNSTVYYSVNVLPTPVPAPSLDAVVSACPGQITTLSGRYFTSDVQAYIVGSNEILPLVGGSLTTSDNVHYYFNARVPSDIPNNATGLSVYVSGSNGPSNAISLVLPDNCSVVTSHTYTVTGPAGVAIGGTAQFTAQFDGVDVTTSSVWSSDASGGVTANDGIFHDPGVASRTYHMNATYSGYSNGAVIRSADAPGPVPPTTSCDTLTVMPSASSVNMPAGQQQFTAYAAIGTATPYFVDADTWLVNLIPGGNSRVGTITPSGLYTAPLFSPGYTDVRIDAQKVVGSENLSGYSVVTLKQTIDQTPLCNVVVASQINAFFGDGRHGYIPAGTVFSLAPGQYLLATYLEELDEYKQAINTGSKQMQLLSYYAEANDVSVPVYNNGALVIQSNGTFVGTYSVLLGVCDPVTGYFQSMWDISPLSQSVITNNIPPQAPCGHGLFISEDKSINLETHVQNSIPEKSLEFNAPKQNLATGTFDYKDGILTLKNINIIVDGSLSYHKEEETIKIKENHILIYNSETNKLRVVSYKDTLLEDSHTIVLGMVKGQFYSKWPSLQQENLRRVEAKSAPAIFKQIFKRLKDSK